MRKITQAEFEAFEIGEYGIKHCPTGDYTDIKHFGGCCSFGERCRFGEGCSLEGLTNCTYIAFDRIGSRKAKAYFIRSDEGLYARCGCFFGSLDELEKRVKDVHKDAVYEGQYLDAIAYARKWL